MTVDYFEKSINHIEKMNDGPFIGFISPRGHLLDYSMLLGKRGHDNWRNPATNLFLSFISFVSFGDNLYYEKENYDNFDFCKRIYDNNKYIGEFKTDDVVLRGLNTYGYNVDDYDSFLISLEDTFSTLEHANHYRDEWDYLKYDLMDFFKKCYSKNDFFYSFGRVLKVHCNEGVRELNKNYLSENPDDEERFIYEQNILNLYSVFKDILVLYLGYDSIERGFSLGDSSFCNNLHDASNGYVFSSDPYILTSSLTPVEKYYNWLLMDWKIKRTSHMVWDSSLRKYVTSNISSFHTFDKEEELMDDINYIRENVPKEYRKEYFK